MSAPVTQRGRAYRRLLGLLRRGDSRDTHEIAKDAERLLAHARAHGRSAVASTWLALAADLTVSVAGDVGRALRRLMRAPGFTVIASLLLGLGVAATTTLFVLVDAVVLKPLPYGDPERLVMVWEQNLPQQRLREGPSPGDLNDWVSHADVFEALTGWWTAQATLRGGDGAAPVTGVQVTSGFFDVFRRAPLLGRTFGNDEYRGRPSIPSGRTGPEPILVLSHRLWQNLGGDPAIVGAAVRLEGRDWRVLGVMPPDFAVPDAEAAFWTPWDMDESYRGAKFPDGPPREARFLRVVGRLAPGVSRDVAADRMRVVASRFATEYPQTNADWSVELVPLAEEVARTSRTGLLLVFGAMLSVLLLVTANVASLAIARNVSRVRDAGVRVALGAGPARLLREHAAESAVCAAATGGLALVLAAWAVGIAVAVAPPYIPRLQAAHLDARAVAFAVALAVIVTAAAVFLPGMRRRAPSVAAALKEGAPISSQRASRVRRSLVVAEIGLTVVLLAGAGWLARSYASLMRVDPGFDVQNLLVLRIAPDVTRYRGQAVIDYYRRVLDAIRELPGVASAGAVTSLPLSTIGSDFYRPYWLEGARPDAFATTQASVRMATPGYFGTLGLRLESGREFGEQDSTEASRVVIVNQRLAQSAWPGQDPVGRTIVLDYQGGPTTREVVGVVRDARHRGPRSEPTPEIFIPHAQNPYLVMNVVVRTTVDPEGVSRAARARALSVDPDQPVHSVTTMDRLLDDTLQQDRFAMFLVGLFAAAGLLTAATGVYALLAFMVALRTREIAVRMAIGASTQSVARLVVVESLMLALAGCAIGALGVAALGRIAGSLLFGIRPQDPATLVATAVVLFVAMLGASWLPARRAARVDPVVAMRV